MSDSTRQKHSIKSDSKNSRRKLIKSAAIGTGALGAASVAPSNWVKPVINSVAIPAHAQTTDDSASGGGGNTTPAPSTTQKKLIDTSINSGKLDYDIV